MSKSKKDDSKVIPIRVKKEVVDILDKLVELGFAKSRSQLLNKIIEDFIYKLYCETKAIDVINEELELFKKLGKTLSDRELNILMKRFVPVIALDMSFYYDLLTLTKYRNFQNKIIPELKPLLINYVENLNKDGFSEDELRDYKGEAFKIILRFMGVDLTPEEYSCIYKTQTPIDLEDTLEGKKKKRKPKWYKKFTKNLKID